MIFKAGMTGIGSLAISQLLGLNEPVVVIFASLLCITPAFYRGARSGLRNILATFIGAILAIVLTGVFGTLFLSIPLGIMMVFGFFFLRGWMEHFPLAAFAFLLLSFSDPASIWQTGLRRLYSIGLGVGVALVINYLVSLLHYREIYLTRLRQVLRYMQDIFERVTALFISGDARRLERAEVIFHPLFREIGRFKDEIADLKRELKVRKRSGGLNYASVVWLARSIDKVQWIAHYLSDIVSFSPDLLQEGLLSGEKKEELNKEMTFIARQLKEVLEAVSQPGGGEQLFRKLKILKQIYPTRESTDEGKTRLQLVSLQLSVYYLRGELGELVKFLAIFLANIKSANVPSQR